MQHPSTLFRRAGLAALFLVSTVLAACTDRNPAAPPAAPSPAPAAVLLRCSVDVRAASLSCRPEGDGLAPGVSAAILGGQGTNVRLASSGTSYDGSAFLRSQVTVENLTAQALGTTDGSTPAPEGVRVFFHAGPQVTGGTGTVSVSKADGEANFTGAAQPYFQYAAPLAPGATSEARQWVFAVPNTVLTFAFTVYVAAAVRSEAGWVGVSPVAPSVVVGDTQRVAATVRSLTGREVVGAAVGWATSNPAVATVDAAGVVTGVAPGVAKITATSGARQGSVFVQVTAAAGAPAPEVVDFSISPAAITADGVDSVAFRVTARDAGGGITAVRVTLASPGNQATRTCTATTVDRVSGTRFDGVYLCRGAFPAGSWNGTWRVTTVDAIASGPGTRTRQVSTADLLAAGAPAHLQVASTSEDAAAPSLDGFTFSPDTAAIGQDTVRVDITASDAGVGIGQASVFFGTPGGSVTTACTVFAPFSGTTAAGTFRCRIPVRSTLPPAELRVDSVRVRDANGNSRVATTAELETAGYPTTLTLVRETTPPTLTAFSFAPDSVAANGVDSVAVSLSAADGASGVWLLRATFSKVGGTEDQVRECSVVKQPAPTLSLSCALRFDVADAGMWQVDEVYAQDDVGNSLSLTTAQLQAAGYATEIVVTP